MWARRGDRESSPSVHTVRCIGRLTAGEKPAPMWTAGREMVEHRGVAATLTTCRAAAPRFSSAQRLGQLPDAAQALGELLVLRHALGGALERVDDRRMVASPEGVPDLDQLEGEQLPAE